jgi:zinc transporter ZupT
MSEATRTPEPVGDPERYRRTLARGILVFRWVWLTWMTALAVTASDEFTIPGLAWASIGAAAAWTAWLTATRHRWTTSALSFDLALCFWLVIASGIVVPDQSVISGRPFFATGYPLSAPLFWGASRGVIGGLLAGLGLGVAHIATRPLNGVALDSLSATQFQNMTGAVLNYVVAGMAIGIEASVAAVIAILVAILAHKGPEGYALGISLYETGMDQRAMLRRVVLYSAMTPLGIVVGAVVSGSLSGDGEALAEAIFDGLAAGTFLYIATFGILKREFSEPSRLVPKFAAALAGVVLIAIVSVWA